jgi:hypothetical protein
MGVGEARLTRPKTEGMEEKPGRSMTTQDVSRQVAFAPQVLADPSGWSEQSDTKTVQR